MTSPWLPLLPCGPWPGGAGWRFIGGEEGAVLYFGDVIETAAPLFGMTGLVRRGREAWFWREREKASVPSSW